MQRDCAPGQTENWKKCESYIPVRQAAVVLFVVGLTPPERNSPSVKDQCAPIPSIGSDNFVRGEGHADKNGRSTTNIRSHHTKRCEALEFTRRRG